MTLLQQTPKEPSVLEGAKNDFVFITEVQLPSGVPRSQLAQEFCTQFGEPHRPRDGFVVIENLRVKNNTAHFAWDFYNCDGSPAEMCGNAARCAVLYAEKWTGCKTSLWQTKVGKVQGQRVPHGSRVELPLGQIPIKKVSLTVPQALTGSSSSESPLQKQLQKKSQEQLQKDLTRADPLWEGYWINSGVPHFVIQRKADSPPLAEDTALKLMNSPAFAPERANITVVHEAKNGVFPTRTFERGVHRYTLACGTGAIAAARALSELSNRKKIWKIQMPGGLLEVEFTEKAVLLSGPCQFIKE